MSISDMTRVIDWRLFPPVRGTQLNFFSTIKYTLDTFEKNLPTLYLCFLQKLIQFWMVSLLEVSLVPERVGGSPLSLKQPKFPGTVRRQGEGEKKLSDTYNPYHMPTYTYMMSDFFYFFLSCDLDFPIRGFRLRSTAGILPWCACHE